MSRTTVLLAVAMLVAAGIPATAALAQESSSEQPGSTFAGVVGVQGAEVEGEIAQRSLDRRLANAGSNASKAAVVAGETETARRQLSALRERRETLERRYESGEITRGEYRSKLAQVGARIRTLERHLNTTAAAAEGIPEETLREHGVNASEIAEMRRNASEVGGGAVAEAARGVGGPDTGKGLSGDPGPPENAGPPDDAGPPNSSNGNGGPPDDAGPPNSSNGNGGPPDDAGPPNSSNSSGGLPDDAGSPNSSNSSGGPPDDAGPPNSSNSSGGPPDDAGSPNSSNGNGGPPDDVGPNDDADGENRGGDAAGPPDDDSGQGSGNGSEGKGSGNGSEGKGSGNGSDGGGRGSGDGASDDGTATPTETPEDDGDRRVDDGRYLALR